MAAVFIRPVESRRARLRLFVVMALVLSLFGTLLARLWYLQVFSGDAYQARAASQSVRDIVVAPPRGLVVDDEGRPLVANRSSWVVSVDRTMLSKMPDQRREQVLRRLGRAVGRPYAELAARTLICGEPHSRAGTCWNGSPFQPVPMVRDVPQTVAVKILEQSEKYPGVLAQTESQRAYPAPFGINAAHLLGYLSPITEGEYRQARKDHDRTLNAASVVGRSGLERSYDRWLRGVPGAKKVAVDHMGRVLGESGQVAARPGDTLVTSIDARVQAAVERNLHAAMTTARNTFDKVTGRNYVADSGAAVVLDAHSGRVVALASQPTYDPKVWVGGISQRQLHRLYSTKAGTPLLSRATQGQFAPGSTWKPIMSVGALNNGFSPSSRLDCSAGLQVGNRWFKNYESASFGYIDFAKALQISCDTFFYRVGIHFWNEYGSDPANVNAKDPLAAEARRFGFGRRTGVDLPGESAGRIADRKWRLAYWKAMKGYYCRVDRKPGDASAYLRLFAHEFCLEGYKYRTGDAVNFAIGQGDTIVTPLQLARAYAALSNGGTLFAPRVAKAIVDPRGKVVRRIPPKVVGHVGSRPAVLRYIDQALKGTPQVGTLAWRFQGFPLSQVQIRGKTGSAEVYGKQSTSWVSTYTKDYVVVMMVSQGGTGSGTAGPFVRKIWESLYGVRGGSVVPADSAIPGTRPPGGLPVFAHDGSILPPPSGRQPRSTAPTTPKESR